MLVCRINCLALTSPDFAEWPGRRSRSERTKNVISTALHIKLGLLQIGCHNDGDVLLDLELR